jgi:hypothetical protein
VAAGDATWSRKPWSTSSGTPDWATQRTQIAGVETAVHFIVNTLGFSR